MGMLTDITPALKVDGKFVPNPLVETQRVRRLRQIDLRKSKTGEALKQGRRS